MFLVFWDVMVMMRSHLSVLCLRDSQLALIRVFNQICQTTGSGLVLFNSIFPLNAALCAPMCVIFLQNKMTHTAVSRPDPHNKHNSAPIAESGSETVGVKT